MTSVDEPPAERCSTLCGMCSSCVFAAEPGSARGLWTLSDQLRRNFIVGLILRCTSVDVLQTIRDALSFTSWDFFNYGRSETLTYVQNNLSGTRNRESDGKPLGLDVSGTWDWFTGSTDVTKSRYLLRLFSFCDSELLRMVANLTNVLLARQERGLLQIDGKEKKMGNFISPLKISFSSVLKVAVAMSCRQVATEYHRWFPHESVVK